MLKRYKMFGVYKDIDVFTYSSGSEPEIHLIGSRRDNNTSSVFTDPNKKTSNINIKLRTNDEDVPTSNECRYDTYVEHLKGDSIKSISEVVNEYKIQLDFSLFDENMNLVDEGVKFYRAAAKDIIEVGPLTVDNKMEYNLGKEISSKFQFHGQGMMPRSFGITPSMMIGVKGTGRYFQINSILVLGKLAKADNEDALALHPTLIDSTFKYTSPTINSIKESTIELYRSPEELFNIIDLGLSPVRLNINIDIILDSFLTPYNTDEIDSIIQWNTDNIVDVVVDDGDYDLGEDSVPSTDMYITYERCSSTNPQALTVVANTIPDDEYDETKMIKIRYVKESLPDVRTGEFVLRQVRLDIDSVL